MQSEIHIASRGVSASLTIFVTFFSFVFIIFVLRNRFYVIN